MAAPTTIKETAPTFNGDEADSSTTDSAVFGLEAGATVLPSQVVGPHGLPATMPAAATRRVAMRRMEYMVL
jgi:hypothetical protein